MCAKKPIRLKTLWITIESITLFDFLDNSRVFSSLLVHTDNSVQSPVRHVKVILEITESEALKISLTYR